MVDFLATLVVGGVVSMGIGAVITIIAMVAGVEWHASKALFAVWREWLGFTRVEFIERTVDEITGTPVKKTDVPASTAEFGPAAGCLAILVFIPMHLFMDPVGWIVVSLRKRTLRNRIRKLTPEQRALIAPEYLRWTS